MDVERVRERIEALAGPMLSEWLFDAHEQFAVGYQAAIEDALAEIDRMRYDPEPKR